MSEISTRIWLDERLWDGVRNRADTERTTIRELIPRLVGQALAGGHARAELAAAPVALPAAVPSIPPAGSGPPVVALSDVYQCGVCGIQVRLGGLSNHLGRHLKEQQAADGERSS